MVKSPLKSFKLQERKITFLGFELLVVELRSVLLPNVVLKSSTTSTKVSFLVSFLKLFETSFGTIAKQTKLDLLTMLNLIKV